MLVPKLYQLQALDTLSGFFRRCRELGGAAPAFTESTNLQYGVGQAYVGAPGFKSAEFADMPYVCLRLPTGGGKTLLACLAVPVAQRELLQRDRSVVLWLVPSRAIQEQTLAALRDRKHPYRQALDNELNQVVVYDLAEALSIQKSTLDTSTAVIVTTLAASRVSDVESRKIYESAGALHHHFTGLDAEALRRLEVSETGAIAYSLANVLRLRRPLVIMDEAHNARTSLSFETLARFRPSCIIELTATPAKGETPSNVLTHVSAKQLAAEDMIKLPIRLETRPDWEQLVSDAVSMREGLERDAVSEERSTGEYIRPLMLLKAERRDQKRATLTVDLVEKALIEQCRIPPEQIARATGDERGLEGVDLYSRECPIRFIITVDALKEGWDCAWAYILCSVAEMKSDTAVEQLIGRVLRLPQARRKRALSLNRAYAFGTSRSFAETARALEDALVDGNGFNPLEAKDLIVATVIGQATLELPYTKIPAAKTFSIGVVPDTTGWSSSTATKVRVDSSKGSITILQPLSHEEIKEAASGFLMETHRAQFEAIATQQSVVETTIFQSPAQRGMRLAVPVLGIERQGHFEWLDETHFIERPWSLKDYLDKPVEPPAAVEDGRAGYGEVGLTDKGKVRWSFGNELAEELKLIDVSEHWSEARLVDWFDRNIPHPDLAAEDTSLFISHVIAEWQAGGWPLGRLVRERYPLRAVLEKRIDACRRLAKSKAFQEVMFDEAAGPVRVAPEQLFVFDNDRYPARWNCERSDDFRKHFHSEVGELKEDGEEFACALFLDQLPEIEMWIRNLERQPDKSFWLPTSSDRFYPDFVCRLRDGRILVVEYKGGVYWSNDDSKEKRRLGELWAERSGGKGIFVMPNGPDYAAIKRSISAVVSPTGWALCEHDRVRLKENVSEDGEIVNAGSEGAIVSVYNGGEAYEVEFVAGRMMPIVVTVYARQLEPAP